MTVDIRYVECDGCNRLLVETGIGQLYEMFWTQNHETKQFFFEDAIASDQKDGNFICNDCGTEIDDSYLALFEVEDAENLFIGIGVDINEKLNQEGQSTHCSNCHEPYTLNGVFQLWDVKWDWNEQDQRFVISHAYPSKIDDCEICCGECSASIDDDLALEPIKMCTKD